VGFGGVCWGVTGWQGVLGGGEGAAHAKRVAGWSGTRRFGKLPAGGGNGNNYNAKLISLFSQRQQKVKRRLPTPPPPLLSFPLSLTLALYFPGVRSKVRHFAAD